jgi:hypothetical protein
MLPHTECCHWKDSWAQRHDRLTQSSALQRWHMSCSHLSTSCILRFPYKDESFLGLNDFLWPGYLGILPYRILPSGCRAHCLSFWPSRWPLLCLPESRCDKDLDTLSGYAMCLPNLTRLQTYRFAEHRPILCVEIKVNFHGGTRPWVTGKVGLWLWVCTAYSSRTCSAPSLELSLLLCPSRVVLCIRHASVPFTATGP